MSQLIKNVDQFRTILNCFPLRQKISYCFAYGSGVFEQGLKTTPSLSSNKPSKGRMIDLVLAVDDVYEWHQANLQTNWSHYSFLKHLGLNLIVLVQQKYGGKIYYNTLVPIGDNYIKYGVISTTNLIEDLLDWDTLYVSGRLHKPTLELYRQNSNQSLTNALRINRESALHCALLLQHESFTEEQLFLTIAGLSYAGDPRMVIGEDRQKVEKIVKPQHSSFRSLYQPILFDLMKDLVHFDTISNTFEQSCSPNAIQWHLSFLPKTILQCLVHKWLSSNVTNSRRSYKSALSTYDLDDLVRRMAFDITYRRYLRYAIKRIVFRSSLSQTIKGFFTAGVMKSLIYSKEKFNKMLQSKIK